MAHQSNTSDHGDHGDNSIPPPPDIGAIEVGAPTQDGNEDTQMSEQIKNDYEEYNEPRNGSAQVQVAHNSEKFPDSDSETTPSDDFESDIDRDFEDPAEIMETIERESELHSGSLDPHAEGLDGGLYEDVEVQQQIENEVDMPDANVPPSVSGHVPRNDYKQRDNSAESTASDQTQHAQSAQPNQSHVNGSDYDTHGVQVDEGSSLFIPEETPSTSRLPSRQQAPTSMPTPARLASTHPAPQPKAPGNSLLAKIKNMQKANKDKKCAQSKRANAQRHIPEPDDEAYLESVLSSTKPSPSTRAPEVSVEDHGASIALTEFQNQRQRYSKLKSKNNGRLTFLQSVEWTRIKGAEESRVAKLARGKAEAQKDEEDEAELLPETHPMYDGNRFDDGEESDSEINQFASSSRKRQRREMPRKKSKPYSMQQAELQSMSVALEAAADAANKKKKKTQDGQDEVRTPRSSGKNKSTRSRATEPKTAPKTSKKGTRDTAKAKRARADAVKQASSLFNSNVFDQQAGDDAREQPTFKARNKQDALRELIASVPLEEKKQIRTDMASIIAATKEFEGHGSVRAQGGHWLVKGMKTSLKGYQVLGSAFLRRRESSTMEPRGGLMADQMGLGKTLMMLANIVNGRPPQGQHPRTTLLVASPALVNQWGQEIVTHTDCGIRVMKYGCGNRVDSNSAEEILSTHDIVLTTYHEVWKSYPKNEPPIDCLTAQQKIAWWKETYETKRGILHRMRFLRIVLDEAQCIKNHLSRTSIACRALMADHRWAMSGTPVLNSLTELYPYFKFIGVPHTGSFKIFKHNYCNSKDAENTDRLLSRLAQFMIRRTHADYLFNAPILKLPQAAQGTYWCDFNAIERIIYDIVHDRFAQKIGDWQKTGELERSYSNILVMLLRLRQLTAHVLMLQFVMRDLLEVEDIERIKDAVMEQPADDNTQKSRTIIAIRKQLEQHAIEEKKKATDKAALAAAKARALAKGEEWIEPEGEDDFEDELQDPESGLDDEEFAGHTTAHEGARLGGSGQEFGKNYNFKPYLASLKTGEAWEKAKERAKCSWCGKAPRQPYIATCGHLICSVPCLEISYVEAAQEERSHLPCKTCGKTPISIQPCDPDEDIEETVAHGTRSKTAKSKAKQGQRRDRDDISDVWLALAGPEVLPSAKTLAIKAQILNWRKEDPKVKIIVYTQFLAMVRILGKICQHEKWEAKQYIGTMSFGARDKAICKFANDPKCNILLASLRCGGLGLNLTMASRVIMVDPWWNEASEQQAFCRVFRIGQKDETFMSRLCVRKTVDERLIAMQDRKNTEINEIMEDDGRRVKRLTPADLMRLFGNVNDGPEEDGAVVAKQFIMVDNPNPQGSFRADRDDEGYADEL